MQINQFQQDALTGKVTVVITLPDAQGSISLYAPETVEGEGKAVIKATATKNFQAALEAIEAL